MSDFIVIPKQMVSPQNTNNTVLTHCLSDSIDIFLKSFCRDHPYRYHLKSDWVSCSEFILLFIFLLGLISSRKERKV